MNEEEIQTLSQQIIIMLYELSNYDQILDQQNEHQKLENCKVTNIDIIYLLKNENLKEMFIFFVNKIKSLNELEKIRETIKIYSLYKEKIDKINILEKRKQELRMKLNEKQTILLNHKAKLDQVKNENQDVKIQLEDKNKKIDLLNTKNRIMEISRNKTDLIFKDFENVLSKTQHFKMDSSSYIMLGDENIKDFLLSNTEFIDKLINKEKADNLKVLPFVFIIIEGVVCYWRNQAIF